MQNLCVSVRKHDTCGFVFLFVFFKLTVVCQVVLIFSVKATARGVIIHVILHFIVTYLILLWFDLERDKNNQILKRATQVIQAPNQNLK